jgi:hypothetical protein
MKPRERMQDETDNEYAKRMAVFAAREEANRELGIKPGIYRLGCDVKNPKADRRARHDWRLAETWTAGTEFVVQQDWEFGHLTIHVQGRWEHHRVALHNNPKRTDEREQAVIAMLPFLVRDTSREAEFEFWFTDHGNATAFELLKRAFLQRRIDLTWMEAESDDWTRSLGGERLAVEDET